MIANQRPRGASNATTKGQSRWRARSRDPINGRVGPPMPRLDVLYSAFPGLEIQSTAAWGLQCHDIKNGRSRGHLAIQSTAARGLEYRDEHALRRCIDAPPSSTAARGFEYCDDGSQMQSRQWTASSTAARGFEYCDGPAETPNRNRMSLLEYFNKPWNEVPIVSLDTETTGIHPGTDRAVQVGIVRFERGVEVGAFSSLVNPGRPIPAEATAIHGITEEMVTDAPTIDEIFARDDVRALLAGAQPAAFNCEYDRPLCPLFTDPWDWPWIDPLQLVRFADRWVKGRGRHRLEETCKRHGIELAQAHSAEADARAAGQLLLKLGREKLVGPRLTTLGQVLAAQKFETAKEWWRFNSWKAGLPPLEESKVANG